MSKKIYVGNLSYNAREEDLTDVFTPYGEVVSAKIIVDRYTNQSKGFGFIEMAEETAGEAAISELNGAEWLGRELKVNPAKEPAQRSRSNY